MKTNKNMIEFNLKSDERLNEKLKQDTRFVRSTIVTNVPNINSRFKLIKSNETPSMTIVDTKTGKKSCDIGLYALQEVVDVLNSLFK